MIKLLQGAVVGMFVLMVAVGMGILFFATDKLQAYQGFVGTMFPVFLSMVVPALIGSPLTDYIRSSAAAKETKAAAAAQAANPNQGIPG
jgi:hypothetical protein